MQNQQQRAKKMNSISQGNLENVKNSSQQLERTKIGENCSKYIGQKHQMKTKNIQELKFETEVYLPERILKVGLREELPNASPVRNCKD